MFLRKKISGPTALLLLCLSSYAYSGIDWVSATLDNDLFIGSDNGYTNGLYFSLFEADARSSDKPPSPDFWVKPLLWTINNTTSISTANTYTFGQTMSTPSDITIANPAENELPYSGLLVMTNNYINATPTHADRIGTTIGLVGPSALGEEAQKFVHSVIGADEPLGWDTQLEDELVFQFSRARLWRKWVSTSGNSDLLTTADFGIGSLQSVVNLGFTFRYGRQLEKSYIAKLFDSSRTANPGSRDGGWHLYTGMNAGYIFNQIFTDGNTFRNSKSIDYKREFIGYTLGIAYSFKNLSLNFALNNANIIQGNTNEETLDNITQFGTLTLAWRI